MTDNNANPSNGKADTSRHRSERGYVLLVFLFFSALLVVGALRILPQAAFQGQREREEEMLFRGQQYQRAIQLFVRKFGRYPNSLEELEETNQIRFLRRRYGDPMTEEGEWRLIHIGPAGDFPDALTASSGSPASGFGSPISSSSSSSEQREEPEESSASASLPQRTPPPFGAPDSAQLAVPGLSQGDEGAEPSSPPAFRFSARPSANPQQQPRAAASSQQQAGGPLVLGAGGIAGVASRNTARSIKVWNGRSSYNEWEFIYNFRTDPLGLAAIARTTGAGAPAQPAAPPAAPAQAGAEPTPPSQTMPAQQPRWLGGPAPGIRPGTPSFPPSPIPGTSPRPRQR